MLPKPLQTLCPFAVKRHLCESLDWVTEEDACCASWSETLTALIEVMALWLCLVKWPIISNPRPEKGQKETLFQSPGGFNCKFVGIRLGVWRLCISVKVEQAHFRFHLLLCCTACHLISRLLLVNEICSRFSGLLKQNAPEAANKRCHFLTSYCCHNQIKV